MRKNFCDKCGAECVNTLARLSGAVEHTTNKAEVAGYDDIRPVELCKDCFATVKDLLGLVVVPGTDDMPAFIPLDR